MVQIRPSRRAFGVGLAAAGALMASARTQGVEAAFARQNQEILL